MYIKQPPLTVSVPVKLFHDKKDGRSVGSVYSQLPLGKIYQWYPVTAPSSEVVWQCTESSITTSDLTEITYDQITKELYETLKTFYIGKKSEVILRNQPTVRDNY